MQKKKLLVIGISLAVMFSLYTLSQLVLNNHKSIEAAPLITLRYLMLAHILTLLMMVGLFIFKDFHLNILVAFLYCFINSVAFTLCQQVISNLPKQHHKDSYLIFHKFSNYEKSIESNYLNLFNLVYMYSVIGALMLGIFLLVRLLLVKYYQRQLGRELNAQVILIAYSSQLKGKNCTICLNDFQQTKEDFYELRTCHHLYHSKCIREWVNYNRTCPICRSPIFPVRRSRQSF